MAAIHQRTIVIQDDREIQVGCFDSSGMVRDITHSWRFRMEPAISIQFRNIFEGHIEGFQIF
jgi:hypothetical protein